MDSLLSLKKKTVLFTDKAGYARKRVLAFALGAEGAWDKMMATVNVIVYSGPKRPDKAVAKYPSGEFRSEEEFFALAREQLPGAPQILNALQEYGFRFRNPSDEADPRLEVFDVAASPDGLTESLFGYLRSSQQVAAYVRAPWGAMPEKPDAAFKPLHLPQRDLTWWYAIGSTAIDHIQAERGNDEYPQRIKGHDLWDALIATWSEGLAARFYETPDPDSIAGLFILAGLDRQTGRCTGLSLSRTWT